MNIVQLILDLLSGNGFGKLAGLLGESETKTRSAAQAAVPALLGALSKLASSGDGAQKVISALRHVDPEVVANPGSVFADSAETVAEKGGSILGSLFSGNTISAIVNALSRLAGTSSGSTKSLLSYLAPLILGMIAKQFAGRSITPQGLTDLFTSQQNNITNALPSGLSPSDIPGLAPAPHGTSRSAGSPTYGQTKESRSAFPWWILPLALLALVGGLYLLWNLTRPSVPTVPDVTTVTKDLTGNFTALTETLNGIKDAASAEKALPRLTELAGKLEGMKALVDKLPDAGKAKVVELLKSNMGTLGDQFSRVLMLPGVTDKLRPALEGIVTKVASLGGLPAGQFALPSVEVTRLGSEVSDALSSLTKSLTGVKDAASAEAALPELSKINAQLDTTKSAWDKLPESGRATIGSVLKSALASLRALVEKVLAFAGVDEKIGQVVKQIMAKLPAS